MKIAVNGTGYVGAVFSGCVAEIGNEVLGTDVDARKINTPKSGSAPIDTDDLRAEPSPEMIEALWSMGASISAYDLAAMGETRRIYGDRADLALGGGPMGALYCPNFETVKPLFKRPANFDGRNLYDPSTARAQGFEYFRIGQRT